MAPGESMAQCSGAGLRGATLVAPKHLQVGQPQLGDEFVLQKPGLTPVRFSLHRGYCTFSEWKEYHNPPERGSHLTFDQRREALRLISNAQRHPVPQSANVTPSRMRLHFLER